MKNNLSYTTLAFFLFRSCFIGMSSHYLLALSKQDAWIGILISLAIGIPIIMLYYKISKADENLNIFEKIDKLFPKANISIKLVLAIIFFSLATLNFYNLISLISTQYLYNTPKIISIIFLIFPIYFLAKKRDQTISQTSTILFYISAIIFIVTLIGISNKIYFPNLLPILENNLSGGILPFVSYNIIPLFMLLMFPNKNIGKNMIYGFILGAISILIVTISMVSILGIELILLLKYPEFYTLKLSYNNIINFRLDNLLCIQWIIDMLIFTAIGVNFTNKSLNNKRKLIPIFFMIIITSLLFNYNRLTYNLITNIFQYIIFVFVIGISIIIYIKQKKKAKLS